jgi:hypothetical protein
MNYAEEVDALRAKVQELSSRIQEMQKVPRYLTLEEVDNLISSSIPAIASIRYADGAVTEKQVRDTFIQLFRDNNLLPKE